MASVVGTRVTVTSSATPLFTLDTSATTATMHNKGASSVFLGDATVTAATGYELGTGEVLGVDAPRNFQLYAIAASSSMRVDVLEVEI